MTNTKTETFTRSLAGRTAIVTGGASGIGAAVARGLAAVGMRVVIACRDEERGETARAAVVAATGNEDVELLIVDLASQASIRDAARRFRETHDRLDVLVNNAGTVPDARKETVDGIELTFATNVLAYHLLTEELLPLLRANEEGARVVNVASGMAYGLELDDVEFRRRPWSSSAAYAQSKHADRLLTWALARRLAGSRVTANAMTPGPVATPLLTALAPGMTGRSVDEGADTIVWLAASPEPRKKNGAWWSDRTEGVCKLRDEATEEALWALCAKMTTAP